MGIGDVSCTANVTYTENGSSVTQSADAVVVAVPWGCQGGRDWHHLEMIYDHLQYLLKKGIYMNLPYIYI